MDDRYKVATTAEFDGDGSYVIEDVRGREVAVFQLDGEYHAILNFCIHQGGPVCEGGVTGKYVTGEDGWQWKFDDSQPIVRCPWHNWGFDIETGVNVRDDRYSIPVYDTVVEDEDIYVALQ